MVNIVRSLFLLLLEMWGSLYFFDTFLQKRMSRLQKYRLFIWLPGMVMASLSGSLFDVWKIVLIISVYTLLCLLFYKVSFLQSIFLTLINYCLLIIFDSLVTLVMGKQILQPMQISESSRYYLMILIGKMLWIVLLLFIRKVRRQKEEDYSLANKEWLQLSFIPMITLSSIIAMLFFYPEDKDIQNLYLFLTIGMVGSNLVVIHLMQEILAKEKVIRVSTLVNQNQKRQLAAYEDGSKVYEQQQKKMHDYKNQLVTIQTLLKGEDYATALNFAEKLTESISVDMSAINTNHPVVNAVLNQKYRSAKEKNISMSLKLGDLHELKMKEEDIVIVLGNLLDNAISECEKLLASGAENVLIFLKLVYEDDKMILSIKNPVREKVEIVDNIVQKEHDIGHGIGLLNVKSAVEHYNADLVLACDEKEFKAVVIL